MYWDIFKDGELLNAIVANEDFAWNYCKANGYTYALAANQPPEPAPPAEEQLRADVDYIAAMLGVEL